MTFWVSTFPTDSELIAHAHSSRALGRVRLRQVLDLVEVDFAERLLTNLPDKRAASNRSDNGPGSVDTTVGFRVAMIPEPSTALLTATGLAAMAVRRRRHIR